MNIHNIQPTETQKTVLAVILNAATPRIAAEDLSSTPNLHTAAEILNKLGVIRFDRTSAELTDAGITLAREENITDEYGALSDLGKDLILAAFPQKSVAESSSLIAELLTKL